MGAACSNSHAALETAVLAHQEQHQASPTERHWTTSTRQQASGAGAFADDGEPSPRQVGTVDVYMLSEKLEKWDRLKHLPEGELHWRLCRANAVVTPETQDLVRVDCVRQQVVNKWGRDSMVCSATCTHRLRSLRL